MHSHDVVKDQGMRSGCSGFEKWEALDGNVIRRVVVWEYRMMGKEKKEGLEATYQHNISYSCSSLI